MWLSKSFLSLFTINKETVDALRTKVSVLEATNSVIERELLGAKINSDWLRVRVNQLEAERAHLIAKAYPGLNVPVPEIARIQNRVKDGFDLQALFNDPDEFIQPSSSSDIPKLS